MCCCCDICLCPHPDRSLIIPHARIPGCAGDAQTVQMESLSSWFQMFLICSSELRSLITKSKKLLEQCWVLGFYLLRNNSCIFVFKGVIASAMQDKYFIEYKCFVVMDEFKPNQGVTRTLSECKKVHQCTIALFYTPLTDNGLLFTEYSQ